MEKTLYDLERKLGMASISPCTDAEANAVRIVESRDGKLPEGIFKDKSGKYFKYDAGLTDESEKDRIVAFDTLYQIKLVKGLLIAIISVLALLAVLIGIVIYLLLHK